MDGTNARQLEGFSINFTSQDFWFTQKGKKVYAIALEYPEKTALIKSMADKGKVKKIRMLGSDEKLSWKNTGEGLEVVLPEIKPDKNGYVLEITY